MGCRGGEPKTGGVDGTPTGKGPVVAGGRMSGHSWAGGDGVVHSRQLAAGGLDNGVERSRQ